MKTKITIRGRNPDGILAVLHVEADADWMPFDVNDADKMKDFKPSAVSLDAIGDNNYYHDVLFGSAVWKR